MRCMCCEATFMARSKQQIMDNEISEYLCDLCLEDVAENSDLDHLNSHFVDVDFEIQHLLYPNGRTMPKFSE